LIGSFKPKTRYCVETDAHVLVGKRREQDRQSFGANSSQRNRAQEYVIGVEKHVRKYGQGGPRLRAHRVKSPGNFDGFLPRVSTLQMDERLFSVESHDDSLEARVP